MGYYARHADKRNTFQLLLVDRGETGAGNFDIVMNYSRILWEAGDASGGHSGLGGTSAGGGFSAGTGDAANFFQFPGSLRERRPAGQQHHHGPHPQQPQQRHPGPLHLQSAQRPAGHRSADEHADGGAGA